MPEPCTSRDEAIRVGTELLGMLQVALPEHTELLHGEENQQGPSYDIELGKPTYELNTIQVRIWIADTPEYWSFNIPLSIDGSVEFPSDLEREEDGGYVDYIVDRLSIEKVRDLFVEAVKALTS